ncbi:MAG: hypothetical protein ABI441_10145 [Flavobacterium sp.]
MLVLNDIELINFLRPLNLLKNGEFLISNLFMSNRYFDVSEKQFINILAEKEDILLFESGDSFYNFHSEFKKENLPIGLPTMASIHYSLENNLPIVTKCEIVKKIALDRGITVYSINEALRLINTGEEKISYINGILNMI